MIRSALAGAATKADTEALRQCSATPVVTLFILRSTCHDQNQQRRKQLPGRDVHRS